MSAQLKRLIEKIVEIMKTEGINWLEIRNERVWNPDKHKYDDTQDYSVNMSYYKTKETINKED